MKAHLFKINTLVILTSVPIYVNRIFILPLTNIYCNRQKKPDYKAFVLCNPAFITKMF